MNLKHILYIFLLLGALSCSEDIDMEDAQIHEDRIEVTIGCSQPSTRTSLDEDGRTTCWLATDKIAVWAKNGTNYPLAAQPFALYTFNGVASSANFSATITPLPADTYTYYAVYPQPTAVNGTTITCTVPDAQNGAYNGTHDVLVASVTGGALGKTPRPELQLNFRHLLHMIRIDIPAGRNLSGEAVKRLEITFPTEVTGAATFDLTAPEQTLAFTGGSRTLTLDFAGAGLSDTQGTCAYAFVRPGEVNGEVTFRAYNAAGVQSKPISTTLHKTMGAGRVTPIALTIPTQRPVTLLDFTVATNNLGEELTNIALTAPDGIRFVAPFSVTGNTTAAAMRDAEGRFTVRVYADEYPAATLSGKTLTINYESTNALLTDRTITLPTLTPTQGRANVPMTVPYLFEEDFSKVTPSFEKNTIFAGSDALNPDPEALDTYGLKGWTGGRVGASAGISLRICSRVESGGWIVNRRPGRVDTTPLSGIKAGKTPKVSVSYDYAGDRYNGSGGKSGAPVITFGYTTIQGAIKVGDEITNKLINGVAISIDGPDQNGTYYGNTPHHVLQTIPVCTPDTRLSWQITNNRGSHFAANGNYWLYIDNIKVQISK
ncbi:MAG: fimbrillin family protein [Alistipes sp.]